MAFSKSDGAIFISYMFVICGAVYEDFHWGGSGLRVFIGSLNTDSYRSH